MQQFADPKLPRQSFPAAGYRTRDLYPDPDPDPYTRPRLSAHLAAGLARFCLHLHICTSAILELSSSFIITTTIHQDEDEDETIATLRQYTFFEYLSLSVDFCESFSCCSRPAFEPTPEQTYPTSSFVSQEAKRGHPICDTLDSSILETCQPLLFHLLIPTSASASISSSPGITCIVFDTSRPLLAASDKRSIPTPILRNHHILHWKHVACHPSPFQLLLRASCILVSLCNYIFCVG
ncbi:hypothetical protein VTL71DRAFT_206 [Oculimacula yallundae]|uniref:Uncharacterized protein n=1 Tax=Oculimacula yallundae TaxID=86028 RepID=A0ABR4D0W2_9HELO